NEILNTLTFVHNRNIILFASFFNLPAIHNIYTLSLHDALPISDADIVRRLAFDRADQRFRILASAYDNGPTLHGAIARPAADQRSEEHTSELQSRENLVCRLLLEKKNKCNKYRTIIRLS